MIQNYYKEWSNALGRDMEFKTYGNNGRLCIAFPPQSGRFFDFENFGMVDVLQPWIDEGRIMLACADGIDAETWSKQDGDPRQRIVLHEQWFHYIVDELIPRLGELGNVTGKAITTGCSMGGFHAANFFFRRPDLIDTVVSLSGLYNADFFIHNYMDDLVYANSPLHFLPNMPQDHPYMGLYRASNIVLCVGQGAWEDGLLESTRRMDQVLREKNIPAWVDYWGYDVCHDWCWWQKQLPYFFGKLGI